MKITRKESAQFTAMMDMCGFTKSPDGVWLHEEEELTAEIVCMNTNAYYVRVECFGRDAHIDRCMFDCNDLFDWLYNFID